MHILWLPKWIKIEVGDLFVKFDILWSILISVDLKQLKEEFLSNSEYNNYYVWLKIMLIIVSFIIYQNGREAIDMLVEPSIEIFMSWFATYLHNNNQTFAEYYNNFKSRIKLFCFFYLLKNQYVF